MSRIKSSKERQQKKLSFSIEERINRFWVPIDQIGQGLMGQLWQYVYETVQDAIALCLLYAIPGWISRLILRDNYSDFGQCLDLGSWTSLDRYACYVLILSGFALWAVLFARILFRLYKSLRQLWKEFRRGEEI